jgi:CMP/dCMP kinase
MIITIDGPVASGKSTISRLLAQRLGYYYLCSGLLYRALSYLLITHKGYTPKTAQQVEKKDIDYCLDNKKFSYCYDSTQQEHIFFDTIDITSYLKDQLIDDMSSLISINSHAREAITRLQQDIASHHNIVTDGRDVGSVVFPHAHYKFFITAGVQVRANRWREDQKKYGHHFSLEEAEKLISVRDERDKKRIVAPLIVPQGAITIDTSSLNITQVIEKILSCIKPV